MPGEISAALNETYHGPVLSGLRLHADRSLNANQDYSTWLAADSRVYDYAKERAICSACSGTGAKWMQNK